MKSFAKKIARKPSSSSLLRNEDGIAAVEFALIAPAFLMLLLGVFDLGFGIYSKTVLQGAVEHAARQASLENTEWSVIEDRVKSQVIATIPGAETNTQISFNINPSVYDNYDDIIMPEDFTDSNGNGVRNPGECYIDRNGNRQYDTNVGIRGRGTGQDVIAITADVTYPRAMPLWGLIGMSQTQKLTIFTYIRNQPFNAKAVRAETRICNP
jgi:Flp pilus assembly pilin Flp